MSGFIIRTKNGDIRANTETEIKELWLAGRFAPGEFIYNFSTSSWLAACEHPSLKEYFVKPNALEKSLIHIIFPGKQPGQQGPFTLTRVKQWIQLGEISASNWVFVEGDKEWRQVKSVKALSEALPVAPQDVPSISQSAIHASQSAADAGEFSLAASLAASSPGSSVPEPPSLAVPSSPPPSGPPTVTFAPSVNTDSNVPSLDMSTDSDGVVRADESTKAVSVLGLNMSAGGEESSTGSQQSSAATQENVDDLPALEISTGNTNPNIPTPDAMPPKPVKMTPPPPGVTPEGAGPDQPSFNGITAEISADAVWLIKQNNSESVSGPFKFLDVVKLLELGKISKNDKISRTGTNRFNKISQQYEFNVSFEVTKKIENGAEVQKILIRRRHPRVDYFTNVQVGRANGTLIQAACVNISAGGILIEAPKLDLTIGETIDLKILPGIINKIIQIKAQVTSKVPKIPPGFSLEFTDLKPDDKEAIERYVQDAIKKEQAKG